MTKQNDIIKSYLRQIGAKGGKTKGRSKARSSTVARRAALARWRKRKNEK